MGSVGLNQPTSSPFHPLRLGSFFNQRTPTNQPTSVFHLGAKWISCILVGNARNRSEEISPSPVHLFSRGPVAGSKRSLFGRERGGSLRVGSRPKGLGRGSSPRSNVHRLAHSSQARLWALGEISLRPENGDPTWEKSGEPF